MPPLPNIVSNLMMMAAFTFVGIISLLFLCAKRSKDTMPPPKPAKKKRGTVDMSFGGASRTKTAAPGNAAEVHEHIRKIEARAPDNAAADQHTVDHKVKLRPQERVELRDETLDVPPSLHLRRRFGPAPAPGGRQGFLGLRLGLLGLGGRREQPQPAPATDVPRRDPGRLRGHGRPWPSHVP